MDVAGEVISVPVVTVGEIGTDVVNVGASASVGTKFDEVAVAGALVALGSMTEVGAGVSGAALDGLICGGLTFVLSVGVPQARSSAAKRIIPIVLIPPLQYVLYLVYSGGSIELLGDVF